MVHTQPKDLPAKLTESQQPQLVDGSYLAYRDTDRTLDMNDPPTAVGGIFNRLSSATADTLPTRLCFCYISDHDFGSPR
jgi:hypothetical protein